MSSKADTPDILAPELMQQLASLLANAHKVEGIEFDRTYFAGMGLGTTRSDTARELLPAGFAWRTAGPTPDVFLPRVPLQLCEFLAYKTALAYETAERIEKYLTDCCTGYSRFRFFDSARKGASAHGVLADAQGYGFVRERKAFVIFRGTSSSGDWKINSTDALTDDVMVKKDKRYRSLRKKYGPYLDMLGDHEPGRHVGFSIAWAAIKADVEDWLAEVFEAGEADKIVYAGHSLGGAMAQIAAFDHARIGDAIGKDRDIRIEHIAAVVTFGAPAVGSTEFANVYRGLLGDRTVLLESSGDLVPRIMTRWYYRMLYPLRQRVKAGVQLHLQANDKFDKVTKPWSFVHEPPLSTGDIDTALRDLAEASRKMAKEFAEKQEEKARTEARAKDKSSSNAGDSQASDSGKQAGDGQAKAGKSASAEGKPGEEGATWVYWVVIGFAALAVTGVAWYFVRRKLFSHDIEQRYALYLSTLSYQQLRAKHGGDLKLANAELADHLRFVRGDFDKGVELGKMLLDVENKPKPFFESVVGLPVVIELRQDPNFLAYLKKNETFV